MTNSAQTSSALSNHTLALHWRLLISLAVLAHLAAVIAAPWSMGMDPRTPPPAIPGVVAQSMSPYLDATYCGHGYRFFCPAPGPSHLVRYTLEMPDGSNREGQFPDLTTQWPRLLYHRHFMLSEKLDGLWNPEEPSRDAPPEAHAQWKSMRQSFESVAQSYANRLLLTSGAKQVKIQLVQHGLPGPDELVKRPWLNDPKLDQVLWTSPVYKKESP